MTHYLTQSELDRMSETELRLKLRQTFNQLAAIRRPCAEYDVAVSAVRDLQQAIRRKVLAPDW